MDIGGGDKNHVGSVLGNRWSGRSKQQQEDEHCR
jgi:hypothetical protein